MYYIYARKQDKVKKIFFRNIAAFKSKVMLEKANYCHEMNIFFPDLKNLFCKLTSIIFH